jgi:uncharacterized repeat protein (TIGR02543 family)
MKSVKYGTTVLTGIIILLTACTDLINEMIPPNDNFITGFQLDGQKSESQIGENTITIPWYEGIPTGFTAYQASVSPKASLLPVTEEYMQAAFPGEENALDLVGQIEATPDAGLTAFVQGLIRQTPNFSIPPLDIPVNFSESVTFLVISGRDGTIRRYTTRVTVTVTFESNGGSEVPVQTIRYGGAATRPNDPGRTGYTFDNWYGNEGLTAVYDFDSIDNTVTENITLYAGWITVYTVTFNGNAGSDTVTGLPGPVTGVLSGEIIDEPATDPSRVGYTFTGWYRDTAGTDPWDFDTDTVTDNIPLYAQWEPHTYTVTFYDDGIPVDSQPVKHGEQVPRPGDPNKTNYDFAGWYSDPGLTLLYNFSLHVTGDLDLYAKWNPYTYTVTFNTNGGSSVPSQTVDHDGQATRPAPPPIKTGYTFAEWHDVFDLPYDFSTAVTVNITLYAEWDANTYTVRYDKNHGDATGSIPPSFCTYNEPEILPSVGFTRDGYDLLGWATTAGGARVYTKGQSVSNLTTIHEDTVTLYAVWASNGTLTYTIIYDANGGLGDTEDIAGIGIPQSLRADGFTRDGYTFVGWARTAAGTVAFTGGQSVTEADFVGVAAGGTVTLYAVWTLNQYTVTFNTNGGSSVPSQTVDHNGRAIRPPANPTRDGYTFDNWYSNSDLTSVYDFSTLVDSNITIYAKWNGDSFTVTFNANGGSPVPPVQTITNGKTATRPTTNPTRDGYTFDNWYSDSAMTLLYDFSTPVDSNITLYAKWNGDTITVTFNSNGGSSVSGQTVSPGATATRPKNPTRAGYTFNNWYSDPDLTSVYNFSTPVDSSITLYAKWIPGNEGPVVVGVTPETVIISRSGDGYPKTVTLTVDDDGYDYIEWYIHSADISGTGTSFTLNAGNSYYNNTGEHFITINVLKGGKLYTRTISFIVVL